MSKKHVPLIAAIHIDVNRPLIMNSGSLARGNGFCGDCQARFSSKRLICLPGFSPVLVSRIHISVSFACRNA